ncbi:hypothetical protein JX266_013542 [Neoarthrinium moseri]|nr:hypothetical protein JX266_013542 [Neoarthrinium moseri]
MLLVTLKQPQTMSVRAATSRSTRYGPIIHLFRSLILDLGWVTLNGHRRENQDAVHHSQGQDHLALCRAPGQFHVAFDGWTSRNHHSLYGVACFFRDDQGNTHKIILGVPEIKSRHFGYIIAGEILDNADDVDMFYRKKPDRTATVASAQRPLASLLPQCTSGRILVTSRSRDVAERLAGSRSVLSIQPMNEDQALQLLQKKLRDKYEDEVAASLVRALDYIPLAITQAAAYILRRWPRTSCLTYLEEVRQSEKKKQSLLHKDHGDLRRDAEATTSVVLTWQITFEQIQTERRSAAELLSFMSLFHPMDTPKLLHEEQLEPHITPIVETEPATAEGKGHWAQLLTNAGWYGWQIGRYNAAEAMLQKAVEIRQEVPSGEYTEAYQALVTERLDTLMSVGILALVLGNQGKYEEAEVMNRRALDGYQKALGADHPDTLTSVYNLAYLCQEQDRFEEADQYYLTALDGYRKVLGPAHPITLACEGHYTSLRERIMN